MFPDFDHALLDDPEFKEDSVREVIITPILSRLGYTPSGSDRVIRSKTLAHPFIYAGTRQVPITLIPDYTLLSEGRVVCVLDAKRPSEDILSRKHVQQAYSYAIHPEIKCVHFALCNGRQLVVFDVDNAKPLLVVGYDEFEARWTDVERFLAPRFLRFPALRKFAPDLGLAFSRLGLAKHAKIVFQGMQLNLFARVSDELMTASANSLFAEKDHCVSIDFHPRFLDPMLAGLPTSLAAQFRNALSRAPFQAAAEMVIEFDAELALGDEVDNGTEQFIPLVVRKVLASRFNHSPDCPPAADIPRGVFRLRSAYSIGNSTTTGGY
nr:type I restriction enzyme HsdR N-terminal domain-containing protein [Bradyrhizobium liaoningense]